MMASALLRMCSQAANPLRNNIRGTSSSVVASCRPVLQRTFSTTDGAAAAAAKMEEDDSSSSTSTKKRQEFVTTTIEPQEWDSDYTDPLDRPKYHSRARVLSRHDYARRDGVTFEEQYQTFEDAGVTLSWLDSKTQKRIYENYLNWQVNAQNKFGKTSHEYVCRLLAQKFRITPFRAAAVIQLQHNEEQRKIKHPEDDHEDIAEMMDQYVHNTIKEAYRSTGETPPESFIEPVPTGDKSGLESFSFMPIEDLMDVDQLTIDTNNREQQRARIMINDHPYIEDIDDSARKIPMCKDSMNLIKMKEKLKKEAAPEPAVTSPAVKGNRPPRWKFVAQTIDTRVLNPKIKKKRAKDGRRLWGKRYRNGFQQDWAENTLIEENDTLRPANLAEVRHMSWKPVRHIQEFTYAGVKQAWLDRTVRGDNSAWGKAPEYKRKVEEEGGTPAAEVEVEEREAEAEAVSDGKQEENVMTGDKDNSGSEEEEKEEGDDDEDKGGNDEEVEEATGEDDSEDPNDK